MEKNDNWSIEYSTKELGVASHGILSVKNSSGEIVRSYEGISARSAAASSP